MLRAHEGREVEVGVGLGKELVELLCMFATVDDAEDLVE